MTDERRIPAGEFVIEYVGEVIDAEELEMRRADQCTKDKQHLYVMKLAPGYYIDSAKMYRLAHNVLFVLFRF